MDNKLTFAELQQIFEEIKELVKNGVKEITLLGQNINIYGRDLQPPVNFIDLLKQVAAIQNLQRIRFVTTHPKDTGCELVELMAVEEKIMPYLHMPFQAGSNKILKKMNRRYTREEYIEKVQSFRKLYPDLSLSTDVIVGYPGETEEDFLLTKAILEETRFDGAFIFKYSDRSGTKAESEDEKLSEIEIKRRHKELLKLQNNITFEKNKELKGLIVKVLVEGISKTDPSRLTGRTEHNRIAVFQKDDNIKTGDIVNATVINGYNHSLYCEYLK